MNRSQWVLQGVKLELFELLFEDARFYRLMRTQFLCNSIYNPKFTRKLKKDYLIPEQSISVNLGSADDIRLQAAEPYQDGPYANVIYKDPTVAWAEFSFTYKSMGMQIRYLSDM